MNLFDLVATLGLDSSSYEKGLDSAESKTESFGSKLKNGLAVAGKAAAAAITAVSAATVAATTAMIKGASQVAAYGDNIDKMSQKMGISAEAYQEWDAVMQHSGTSIETLKSSMKILATQAEQGNEAFQKLGITEEELANLSQEDLFERVITGLQEMEQGTERTYITSQLLGRGATELGALLNMSAEETKAMRERVHELGGVMSNEAVKSSAQFADNLQDMKTAISGLKRNITAQLLPGLNDIMAGFTSLIIGEENAEEVLETGFDKLFESLGKGFDKIVEIGEKILPRIISSITKMLPKLIPMGLSIVKALAQGILQNLPEMLNAVTSIISDFVNYISANLKDIIKAGVQILKSLIEGLLKAIPDLIQAVLDLISAFVDAVIENLPDILDTGFQILSALLDGIVNNLPKIVTTAAEITVKLISALIEHLPELLAQGAKMLAEITTGLIKAIPELIKELPKIFDAIFKAFSEVDWIQLGADLINAVGEGILNTISTLWDVTKGAFKSYYNSVEKFFNEKNEETGETNAEFYSKALRDRAVTEAGTLGSREDMEGYNALFRLVNSPLLANDQDYKEADAFLRRIGYVKSMDTFAKGAIAGIDSTAIEEYNKMREAEKAAGLFRRESIGSTPVNPIYDPRELTGEGSGVTINVYGAEGQNVSELADIVSKQIATRTRQERRAW